MKEKWQATVYPGVGGSPRWQNCEWSKRPQVRATHDALPTACDGALVARHPVPRIGATLIFETGSLHSFAATSRPAAIDPTCSFGVNPTDNFSVANSVISA